MKIKPGCTVQEHNPELIPLWSSKNTLKPDEISYGSNKTIYLICKKHGDYPTTGKAASRGRRCPTCSHKGLPPFNESLAYLRPDIASTWSSKNDCTPFEVWPSEGNSKHSGKRIWICPIHGDYEATCADRTNNRGCRLCGIESARKKKSIPLLGHSFGDLYPSLLPEWSNKNSKGPHCCNLGRSQAENFLRSSLTALGSLPTTHKIGHWEVDIFFPERNTIIEYDGSYYHSFPKSLQTDTRKSLDLLSQGYTLIRVRTYSKNYQLSSLQIPHPSYHEIFTSEPLDSQPTSNLLDKITSLL